MSTLLQQKITPAGIALAILVLVVMAVLAFTVPFPLTAAVGMVVWAVILASDARTHQREGRGRLSTATWAVAVLLLLAAAAALESVVWGALPARLWGLLAVISLVGFAGTTLAEVRLRQEAG